jgi:carbamoyl-phosphate synthase large subunit
MGNLGRVLVVDGNTGPGLAVARSLGRAGWDVVAPESSRAARSRFVRATISICDPLREPDRFVDELRAKGVSQGIRLFAPSTDASLELCWLAVAGTDIKVLGGDERTVRISLSKVEGLRAAEAAGFPTPAWFVPSDHSEAHEALDRLGAPCVVKPQRSFVRVDDHLEHRRHAFAHDATGLKRLLETLRDRDGTLPVLQRYVPGRSLSVSAVVTAGQTRAFVARETFSSLPIAGGTSVWKRTVAPSEPGVRDACRLLVAVGLAGLAEVEYQVDVDGIPRFMEIGARAHGWIPLAIAAGVDLPALAAAAACGEVVDPIATYAVGVEMRWLAGEARRLMAATNSAMLPPGVTRKGVLADAWPPWRPGMRYDGLDFADLRPTVPNWKSGTALFNRLAGAASRPSDAR